MKLIIVGPPAAGKGTQAEVLSKKLEIPHISSGAMFRASAKEGNPLGLEAKKYTEKGLLVPDNIVLNIVMERISRDDCKAGYILDGFPRTEVQSKILDEELHKINSQIDFVVDIKLADSEIVNRILGRRICSKCGETYHMTALPPAKEGICDNCSSKLIQRDDDTEHTILERVKVYHHRTEPLINYYNHNNKLIVVNGESEVHSITSEILLKIGRSDLI